MQKKEQNSTSMENTRSRSKELHLYHMTHTYEVYLTQILYSLSQCTLTPLKTLKSEFTVIPTPGVLCTHGVLWGEWPPSRCTHITITTTYPIPNPKIYWFLFASEKLFTETRKDNIRKCTPTLKEMLRTQDHHQGAAAAGLSSRMEFVQKIPRLRNFDARTK